MSQTREGALKAQKTMRERYGEDCMERWGRKGGSAKVPKGFAKNPRWKVLGAAGGRKSKRSEVKSHGLGG